jgi:hypothetical protein
MQFLLYSKQTRVAAVKTAAIFSCKAMAHTHLRMASLLQETEFIFPPAHAKMA